MAQSTDILMLAEAFEKKAGAYSANASPSFYKKIGALSQSKPNENEWESWLRTNATVLGDLGLSDKWSKDTGTNDCISFKVGKKYYFISSKPNLDNDWFDIQTTSILKGVPPIKNLWLMTGTNTINVVPSKLNKNLAHEAWLDKALYEMFKTEGGRITLFESFLYKNKKAIDKLRSSFHSADPLFVGGGEDGAAFDLGNGRILKLFKDDVAYTKTKEAFDRLHKNPNLAKTEAMIYDVGFLGKYMNIDNVYYSIVEKMTMIPEEAKDKIFRVVVFVRRKILNENKETGMWKKIKDAFKDDPKKSKTIMNFVRRAAKKFAKEYFETVNKNIFDYVESKIPNLKPNWLQLYIEEILIKYLTGRTDLHMGNLGITDYGELRYFDPAYSERQSFVDK